MKMTVKKQWKIFEKRTGKSGLISLTNSCGVVKVTLTEQGI
jgi:hypothetical protein